ncbi:MAG TPA: SEC-C metal-binding domain-containing protein, partial [Terriglobales bacterium]|nr:SEC-C metal-binding domain-containing protein [Terriglobales bacterium]
RQLERLVLLETLDSLWKDHLLSMDHLKQGINLRGYGQKNPLNEYKKEGFELFETMMNQFEEDVVQKIFTVQIARQEDVQKMEERRRPQPQMVMSGGGVPAPASGTGNRAGQPPQQTVRNDADKVGRNDPCPCGSGKKYKKCHG